MASPSQTDAAPLVIVVDDDDDTRLNLRDILELDGYQVETVGTAHELLSRQNWEEVELVLLDRKLPDGNPEEILVQVGQLAPHAAVIMITGYADIEGAITALRGGAADYILKPINAHALRASVHRVLAQRHAQYEIARLSGEVRRGQERYQALFENTLDGLIILDSDQQIMDCNPAAESKLGYETNQLRGNFLDTLLAAPNEGGSGVWARFFGTGRQGGECQLSRADGGAIFVEFRAVENFAPGLHLLSIRDVTGRKLAEERMRQSERLAAVGETMAGLIHESRNALQRSKACLEMLSLEVEDRPAAQELVVRAQKAQDDLHRLYEEVRQWAAPLNLRREPTNLRNLWTQAWNELQQVGANRGIRLRDEIKFDLTCEVDPFAMSQVFRNIFENAIDASPDNAVVTIKCLSRKTSNGNEICLAIEDQGRGLTKEALVRIFEPFFTTKAKGTGLGMAIVQRIVQSHGGTVSATAAAGARIDLVIPRGKS